MSVDELLKRLRAEAVAYAAADGLTAPPDSRPWRAPSLGPATRGTDKDLGAWEREWLSAPGRPWRFWLAGDELFLVLLYEAVLCRQADPAGLEFWTARLNQGVPRLEVWLELLTSAEHRSLRWGWQERVAVRAKQFMLSGRRSRYGRFLLRRLEMWLKRRARRSTTGLVIDAVRQSCTPLHDSLRRTNQALQDQTARLELVEERVNEKRSELAQVCAPPPDHDVQRFLAELEVAFRGSADNLQRQFEIDYGAVVLEAWARCQTGLCLDLGCGRGVWLEWLESKGIPGIGVDANPSVAEDAQHRGLQVEHDDVVEWLRRQPDCSAAVVSALHLMEHLPLAARLAVARESARVLKPGGVLILETPDPENIWVGAHTFYNDPTHTQPLTPDSLAFMVKYVGLELVAVPRLHPYPEEAKVAEQSLTAERLNGMTCGGQDFAVIARKALPPTVTDGAGAADAGD